MKEYLIESAIDIIDSTKLQDYQACMRYGMLAHVFGWKSNRPNNHLVFGSAWHLAMEHLLLHGYSAQTIVEAYDLFEAEYRASFEPDTDEIFFPKTPQVVFLNLAKYVNEYRDTDTDFATLHTEIAGSVPILYGLRIHFKLDSILQRISTGHMSSREHKTGSRLSQAWRDQWSMKIQTGTYQHVLHCLWPPEQVEGIVINGAIFTSGIKKAGAVAFERVPIKRSPAMMEEWLSMVSDLAGSVVNSIDSLRQWWDLWYSKSVLNLFPKNTEHCGGYSGCLYRDFCSAWANPLHYIDTVPSGFKTEFWNPVEERSKMKMITDL